MRIFSFIAQTSLRSFPDDRRAFEILFGERFFERGRNTFSLSLLPKIDGLLIDTKRNQVLRNCNFSIEPKLNGCKRAISELNVEI